MFVLFKWLKSKVFFKRFETRFTPINNICSIIITYRLSLHIGKKKTKTYGRFHRSFLLFIRNITKNNDIIDIDIHMDFLSIEICVCITNLQFVYFKRFKGFNNTNPTNNANINIVHCTGKILVLLILHKGWVAICVTHLVWWSAHQCSGNIGGCFQSLS